MSVYSPRHPMPSHVHAKLIEVRRNPGIHVEYPFGHRKFPNRSQDKLIEPTYTGYTFRVFFFATDATSHTRVDIYYSNKWYSGAQVTSGKSFFYSNVNNWEDSKEELKAVPAGSYYSMGCRYRADRYLSGVFDDKVGKEADMSEKLQGYAYHMNITAEKHVVLSIHVSDELHQHFPSGGLGKHVQYPNMKAEIGSTYTAVCVFTGSSKTVKVKIRQDNAGPVATFTNVSLQKNEAFTVYIRNHPEHWLVQASFNPKPQILKGAKYRDYIDAELEEGGYIKRLTYKIMLH
ncbi:uncharacterized protein LOC144105317 [Amblyomma americanum]